MSQHRVLFVDDEPHILSALRRMLRGHAGWDLSFASGGAEALAELATCPADVVVSDMRMPGMDGGELLAEVRRRYPATARLILSGQADREAIISAVGPTQQFLAKPCDADMLLDALTRVLAVRDLVTDERLRGILGDVESLPKPPAVHERMIEVSSRPGSSLSDVVAVIESDLALCAEILKLVNSAFFGLASHVESVERAASLLGLDTIQALAISGQTFAVGPATPHNLDVVALGRDGMRAAGYARALADAEGWGRTDVGQAFLTALLRDVGTLVLAPHSPQGWEEVCAVPASDLAARSRAELDAFGCTVGEASAYILGMWGFAEPVVDAMARQPASAYDAGATPLAHVVTFARLRSGTSHVELETGPENWLDEARLERWNRLCDSLHADRGELG